MKRLGETAVSPDGKWLAYSLTIANLDQNTKGAELWMQAIAGGEPFKLAVGLANDSSLQFSPDGKKIAWISGRSGTQQIWVADFDTATGTASNPVQMTHASLEPQNVKWSPDGRSMVFSAAVYPDCPAFTEADAAEGSAADACNRDRDKAAAESKVKAQIFTALLYRHWNHYTGEKRSHLFLASVDTGKMRDLTPDDAHDVPPFSVSDSSCGCAFSPDGKELAFTENPDPVPAISTSAQIYTLDLTDASAKPRKVSTSAGGNFNPAYSPDGKYLAWRSQARAGYEADKFRLMLYDREKGGKSASQQASESAVRDLLPHFDNWVDEFAWSPDSELIYFTSEFEGTSPVFEVGLNGKMAIYLKLQTLADLHPLPDNHLVCALNGIERPAEIISISPSIAGKVANVLRSDVSPMALQYQQITHLNDKLLSQLPFPRMGFTTSMKRFWFSASDGTRVEGFVVLPPDYNPHARYPKKYPVKFLIHGGPQGAWGDSWSYRWNAELFAANGYVVVMINPRGSTGYGQAFVDGVNGDWGGKPFTDLMTGLTYAEQHYSFIDKDRECALGASYGGYMANWILGHTDRFKCIVSHDGMFNAESAFGSTEEDWFNEWEFKGRPWDYYGKPDSENPFRKWSPSLSAKNFKTPTLVIHGQLDYRLDVSEGFQLFDTLQLEGVPSKMLYFPDEGHWVLKPQNSQLWWKTVNDWVDQWIGPGPAH